MASWRCHHMALSQCHRHHCHNAIVTPSTLGQEVVYMPKCDGQAHHRPLKTPLVRPSTMCRAYATCNQRILVNLACPSHLRPHPPICAPLMSGPHLNAYWTTGYLVRAKFEILMCDFTGILGCANVTLACSWIIAAEKMA